MNETEKSTRLRELQLLVDYLTPETTLEEVVSYLSNRVKQLRRD